jgi:hypothetical protein
MQIEDYTPEETTKPYKLGGFVVNYQSSMLGMEETCSCNKIRKRMECLKCGYPFSKAETPDDGSDCGCTTCHLQ